MLKIYWLHCNKCGFHLDSKKNIQFILCSCQDILCSKCFGASPQSSSSEKLVHCILCNASVRTSYIESSMNPSLKKLFAHTRELAKYSLNDIRTIMAFQKKQQDRYGKVILMKDKKMKECLNKIELKLATQKKSLKNKNLNKFDEILKYEKEISQIDTNIKILEDFCNKFTNEAKEQIKSQCSSDFNKSTLSNVQEKCFTQLSTVSSSRIEDMISLSRHVDDRSKLSDLNAEYKCLSLNSRKREYSETNFSQSRYFNPLISSTPLTKGNKKMLITDKCANKISPIYKQ